jgi:hypothetical protein
VKFSATPTRSPLRAPSFESHTEYAYAYPSSPQSFCFTQDFAARVRCC